MPCGCSFFDKAESTLPMFCALINHTNGSMARCNESPYCRFEQNECRPRNDFGDLLEKRRNLCSEGNKVFLSWLSGSVVVALLSGFTFTS